MWIERGRLILCFFLCVGVYLGVCGSTDCSILVGMSDVLVSPPGDNPCGSSSMTVYTLQQHVNLDVQPQPIEGDASHGAVGGPKGWWDHRRELGVEKDSVSVFRTSY